MNHTDIQQQLDSRLAFLAQDETNLNLLTEVSSLYMALNDFENAQLYLDKAHALDATACLAHQGMLSLNQGQFEEAKQSFINALAAEDTPALHYNLSFAYFLNGELDDAERELETIIEQDELPEAKLLMARILHIRGGLEEAIDLVEQVIAENHNHADALGFLSLLYFDVNEEDKAKETSLQTLVLDADNYDAQLVRIMVGLLNREAKVEDIEALMQINPRDSRLWFALGNTYMMEGDLEAAEQTLAQAVEIYPEFYDCHIALAWCQLLNDHDDKAHETYQNAVALVDELADGWGGLALIYALNQEIEQAQQLINKANELNPDCFLTQLADMICSNTTDTQKANQQLVQLLKDTNIPISEKLASVMEQAQNIETIH